MLFGVAREDEKIIHVDNQPSFGDHILEGIVHESLESGRGITQAEEHDSWFKEAFVGDKHCFPLISILDVNIVVSRANIHLSEDRRPFELVHKVGDEREGVSIFNSVLVQVPVILTGSERPIFLSYKEEWGSLRRFRWSNLSLPEVILYKLLSSFSFLRRQRVCFCYLGDEVLSKVDCMIIWSWWG